MSLFWQIASAYFLMGVTVLFAAIISTDEIEQSPNDRNVSREDGIFAVLFLIVIWPILIMALHERAKNANLPTN